ncbi:MAG: hypothetical protein JW768_00235 [Chitinispirillaceae bacterium]|nr:hypothetical protein [Chitinispirillaceae bacterium]
MGKACRPFIQAVSKPESGHDRTATIALSMGKKEQTFSPKRSMPARTDTVRLSDLTFKNLGTLGQQREELLSRPVRVCIERARLLTRYLRDMADLADSPALAYAGAVRHVLINKQPHFFGDTLVAGSTGSKPLSAPVYPEFTGLMIWPELDTISMRKRNPALLDPRDARELDQEIFPFWMERTVLERTRKAYANPPCLKLFEQLVYFIAGKSGCMSHTVPDFRGALATGTHAIRARVAEKLRQTGNKRGDGAARQRDFYAGVDLVLDGIETYARNLSQEAARVSEATDDPLVRDRYRELARICSRVPRLPATTLHEAVNALWILQVGIHAENINMAMSPGRLDQILYPFYKRDVAQGRIDPPTAMELLGSLWLKFNDNTGLVPESSEELFGGAGTVPAVTVGGIDEHGNDAVNECTYMLLRVAELLTTRDPSLNARYCPGINSETYRNRVAEVIASTRCIPAVYNDKAAIATLVNQGVSLPHARDYAIIGCVELASAGRSYDASSSIMLNLPAALELALFNGKRPSVSGDLQVGPQTGDPRSFTGFAQLWQAFCDQVSWVAGEAIRLNEYFGAIHRTWQPSPLLSALFRGPLDSGKDLIDGGALYNSSGATHIGFADTVDSLAALQQAVYNERSHPMDHFLSALSLDFKNDPALHAWCKNRAPKFGTGHPVARNLSARLAGFLYDFYQRHTNYRGGRYRPAYWTMTNHAGQGTLCGALPSGRKAGETFSSGMTPVAGAAPVLTECLAAVAAIDTKHLPGGMALNLKYPALRSPREVVRLGQVIEAYCAMGGMHIQCNVMTREMLLDAKKFPHRYPNLLVRVSGYSAYFADLTPCMQDEIIARTAYDMTDGTIHCSEPAASAREKHARTVQ